MESNSSLDKVRAKVGNGKVYSDEINVSKVISKWHILTPLFIALPNNHDFKPIMLVEKYKKRAFYSNKKKSKFIISYSFFSTVIALILFIYLGEVKLLNLTLSGLALTIYFTIEHLFLSNDIKTLTCRNIFNSKLSKSYKKHALTWLLICVLIGLIQILMTMLLGFEASIYEYGGVYEFIDIGEWWRIITASVFHSGLIHWFTNLIFLLISGPLFISIVGSTGFFTFVTGCIVGAFSAYLLYKVGFSSADVYGGISAGVYALLGYIALFTHRNKKLVTGKIYISLTNFLFMSTALSLLLSPSTSNIAHISGFLSGYLLASFSQDTSDKYEH